MRSPLLPNVVLRTALAASQRRRFRRLLALADAPAEAQRATLAGILAANAETLFGREHGFSGIDSVQRFRDAVPVASYEDLRALIARQERTGEPCLTAERPIYFSRTSGTTALPKDIPVTASGLAGIRALRRVAAYAMAQGPPLLKGRILAITGRAVEGHLPGGTPYGAMSGLLQREQPALLRARHVLPEAVADIDDYESQYLAIAACGAAEPRVSAIGTANPSTLVRLLAVLQGRQDEIVDAVARGRLPQAGALPLGAQPRRAATLRRLASRAGPLTFADLWPQLAAVVTWKGGSCGIALGQLAPALPPACAAVELGYLASEMHGTVNVDVARDACLPALGSVFFEFAERDAWESRRAGARADLHGLAELEPGREYYVFVTTVDGLYRYDMNDIVRVTGFLRRTPTLAFVQKGKGVTSITGEKLHEAQVLAAVAEALRERRCAVGFFVVLADRETASYILFLEVPAGACWRDAEVAAAVDARLAATNVEYASKRRSGRLAPLRLRRLRPGAGDAYRRHCVAAGQRDAQFKYLHLQYADAAGFDFAGLVEEGEEG